MSRRSIETAANLNRGHSSFDLVIGGRDSVEDLLAIFSFWGCGVSGGMDKLCLVPTVVENTYARSVLGGALPFFADLERMCQVLILSGLLHDRLC